MSDFMRDAGEAVTAKFVGRTIIAVALTDEKLTLTFEGGKQIVILDDGQDCCESRYMTTDDEVSSLVGHKLRHIEAKEGPDAEADDDGCHEIVFVEVGTDDGCITLVNHNEHNGYYGGFGLTVTEVSKPDHTPPAAVNIPAAAVKPVVAIRTLAEAIEAERNAALDEIEAAMSEFLAGAKDLAASRDYIDRNEMALWHLKSADWKAGAFAEPWNAAKRGAAVSYCVHAARKISDYMIMAGVNMRPECEIPRAFMLAQASMLTASKEWADEIVQFAD